MLDNSKSCCIFALSKSNNMTPIQLNNLQSASLPELKQLIDTMQGELNFMPLEKKVDALKFIAKIIDIYTIKRFGKKF